MGNAKASAITVIAIVGIRFHCSSCKGSSAATRVYTESCLLSTQQSGVKWLIRLKAQKRQKISQLAHRFINMLPYSAKIAPSRSRLRSEPRALASGLAICERTSETTDEETGGTSRRYPGAGPQNEG